MHTRTCPPGLNRLDYKEKKIFMQVLTCGEPIRDPGKSADFAPAIASSVQARFGEQVQAGAKESGGWRSEDGLKASTSGDSHMRS